MSQHAWKVCYLPTPSVHVSAQAVVVVPDGPDGNRLPDSVADAVCVVHPDAYIAWGEHVGPILGSTPSQQSEQE